VAAKIASMPPVASLFAAFLGYNPMGELIPHSVLASLPAQNVAVLTGTEFFPGLMATPFKHGLILAFTFSAILYLIAAFTSWKGGSIVVRESETPDVPARGEGLAQSA
jgi:hypothetical protein